jgi:hypothetical protein
MEMRLDVISLSAGAGTALATSFHVAGREYPALGLPEGNLEG